MCFMMCNLSLSDQTMAELCSQHRLLAMRVCRPGRGMNADDMQKSRLLVVFKWKIHKCSQFGLYKGLCSCYFIKQLRCDWTNM